MAEFCTLCGYHEIDINNIYDKHIKPELLKNIATIKDTEVVRCGVGGICEQCGIVSISVNNKFEVFGGYLEEKEHQFGYVDKESLDLIIFEDDPKYNEQRENIKSELIFMKLDIALIDVYCLFNKKNKSELSSEDFERISVTYDNVIKLYKLDE